MKVFVSFLVTMPASKTLSLNWNFGSLLGFIYVFQVMTGFFLVFYYSNDIMCSFNSVQYIMYEVNGGWLLRIMHFNGASFFFFIVFLHFFKGLFFSSYRLVKVWVLGLLMMFFLMGIAFMGYVLVWAQMSFWASVVITSLLTVIPIYGFKLVFWIWSGFSVSGATLKFFFVLHFLLPWVLVIFIMMHCFFLHDTGSTSKILYCGNLSKVNFFPFYWLKDAYNIFFFLVFFIFLFCFPFILGDPEMFLEADFLNSPVHIVPEWYFLFAYAILRAIPNKVLGVLFLIFSICIFFFFIFFFNYMTIFNMVNKFLVFLFLFNSIFLSWLGQCHVEPPYIFLGLLMTFFYFFFVFLIFFFYNLSFFLFFFVFIMILMLKF